jgi:hypothetical protein
MFQRRRRETRFRIEQLEGRNAPSIVITSATVPKESDNGSFTIHGYTTRPTEQGDRLTFSTSVCCGTAHGQRRPGKGETTVQVTLHEFPKTGHFTAHIFPDYIYPYRYAAGQELKIVAKSFRESDGHLEQTTTEWVRIELI